MKTKTLVYIGVLAFFFTACSAGGVAQVDKPASANVLAEQSADEESHELIIIDPGFSRWFASYGKPVGFYAPSYYEQWNRRYTMQWNRLVNQQAFNRSMNNPFENHINYQDNVDYGLKLNHQLYWYFRYVEALYGDYYDFGFGRGNRIL